MSNKLKLDGHVAHVLYNPDGCYTMYAYTVDPTRGLVRVWLNGCVRDCTNERESSYMSILDVKIVPRMLGRHGYLQDVIRAVKDHIFNPTTKEEKKMIEYYVIDIEMTFADYKTKATECLQVRQSGNYFEIPFDGPDCSEYRLDRLEKCLHDYILGTKKMFRVSLEKSEICSNSVLKITTPYGDISDDANREELCKMLAYAAEHREYPYPICNAGLSKICFCLRECKNNEIYRQVYSAGIDCIIRIDGMIVRGRDHFNYIPTPTDVIGLRFKNGRLTHFVFGDDPLQELEAVPGKTPEALHYIYYHDKPFQHVEEVKSLLRDICAKRNMWKNASYITFAVFNDRD